MLQLCLTATSCPPNGSRAPNATKGNTRWEEHNIREKMSKHTVSGKEKQLRQSCVSGGGGPPSPWTAVPAPSSSAYILNPAATSSSSCRRRTRRLSALQPSQLGIPLWSKLLFQLCEWRSTSSLNVAAKSPIPSPPSRVLSADPLAHN